MGVCVCARVYARVRACAPQLYKIVLAVQYHTELTGWAVKVYTVHMLCQCAAGSLKVQVGSEM